MDDAGTLDRYALGDWLREQLGAAYGCVRRATPFGVGQSNPTYRVDTDGDTLVVRSRPRGPLLPSAHAIDREFRVMSALRKTGFPVPDCLAYCDDEAVIGSAFYAMAFVAGRHFADPALPGVTADERRALCNAMTGTLAQLHAIDPTAANLADYARPGAYLERQIGRWTRQYRESKAEPIPAMEELAEALPHRIPAEGPARVCHGDYRADNLLFHPTEPRVIAVLDWELSTLGPALADLSYHLMIWELRRDQYRFGLADRDLPVLGIPSVSESLANYRLTASEASVADWDFWVTFHLFRLAAILQGIRARAASGSGRAGAAAAGANAPVIARLALERFRRLR